ncbi:hypothetical protein PAMP_009152 [Pampus punctatissimus]
MAKVKETWHRVSATYEERESKEAVECIRVDISAMPLALEEEEETGMTIFFKYLTK